MSRPLSRILEPAAALLERVAAPAASAMPVPRLLVVLAHPDDEVLALGGRLERLAASRLLTVTDGAPADGADARHHGFGDLKAYRAARRGELAAALALAGLGPEVAPVFSAQVADQTASLHLLSLIWALEHEMLDFQPEAVLTHPYEGGHPDHDACAFAVHMAAKRVAGTRGAGLPVPILEAPFYHAGEDGSLRGGDFLPGTNLAGDTLVCDLSAAEQERKRARLACFQSQQETLSQFGVAQERYRVAPAYDFSRRPHPGQLLYERFPWGMQGDHFLALAGEAEEALRRPTGKTLPPATGVGGL